MDGGPRGSKIATISIAAIAGLHLFALAAYPQSPPKDPISSHIETLRLRSEVFDNTRTIRILLPPAYRAAGAARTRYPVLYLADGNTVFRRYNLEQAVHGLIVSGSVEPLIIVGIDNGGSTDKTTNAGRDRANEYLPYPDAGFAPDRIYPADPAAPAGKLYPKFLAEVMSLIDKTYRTKTDAKHTGIGGSSYGGVAALFAVTAMPETFGRLLIESTPLWIGPEGQLMKDLRGLRRWPDRVYIGLGTDETPDEVVSRHGVKLRDEMVEHIKTASPRTKINAVLERGGKHDSASWAGRFPNALRFLYGGE